MILAAVIGCAPIGMAAAQIAPPVSDAPDGAVLFRRQCAVCHSLNPTDPARVGPHLAGVMGRTAGSVAGYAYSPGLAAGGFVWDEERLDPYLTNPQAIIVGGKMSYRQANPAIRRAIIDYLKEQS